MKTLLPMTLLSFLLTAGAECQEPVKVKVAVVRLDMMMRDGYSSESVRLLSLDKETLAAMQKIGAEVKAARKEIADAADATKLSELQARMQFLSQKLSIVSQSARSGSSSRDQQTLVRDFVIETYKDKYQVILQRQQYSDMVDPVLWKGGAEITDITEEARDKFREHLNEISGGLSGMSMLGGVIHSPPPRVRPVAEPPAPPEKKEKKEN
jgi:hypothetical protein